MTTSSWCANNIHASQAARIVPCRSLSSLNLLSSEPRQPQSDPSAFQHPSPVGVAAGSGVLGKYLVRPVGLLGCLGHVPGMLSLTLCVPYIICVFRSGIYFEINAHYAVDSSDFYVWLSLNCLCRRPWGIEMLRNVLMQDCLQRIPGILAAALPKAYPGTWGTIAALEGPPFQRFTRSGV